MIAAATLSLIESRKAAGEESPGFTEQNAG